MSTNASSSTSPLLLFSANGSSNSSSRDPNSASRAFIAFSLASFSIARFRTCSLHPAIPVTANDFRMSSSCFLKCRYARLTHLATSSRLAVGFFVLGSFRWAGVSPTDRALMYYSLQMF